MSQGSPSGNFLDRGMILAIGFSIVVMILWQNHLQKKYPDAYKPSSPAETQAPVGDAGASQPAAPAGPKVESARAAESTTLNKVDKKDEVASFSEELTEVNLGHWNFKLSSIGMGLREITLLKYKDRQGQPIRVGGEVAGHLPLETALLGFTQPLHFRIEKISDKQLLGRAQSEGMEITKRMEIEPDHYRINTEIEVKGASERFLGLTTYLAEPLVHLNSPSFFNPQLERHELFFVGGKGKERFYVAPDSNVQESQAKVAVAVVGTPYFAQAVVDHSDVMPEIKASISAEKKELLAALNYSLLSRAETFRIRYSSFVGPRYLHLLEKMDSNLASAVDFGFFSAIGRPILRLLKWFQEIVGNWGVAIILLVLVVRLLVLPFNIMSYKSMKAMQIIQPHMQALREKYKDDQQRLNQETLALFKEHKVNPVGGCLPVLMQIPIFLALYQVLGHSVELYQAPFILWIHDLTLKDPFFVLPILMGVTMFVQQKITPSTLDPMQAKILLALPIVFTFFMLALPSGLTLYFLISGIFGVGQQLYFMKSLNTNVKA